MKSEEEINNLIDEWHTQRYEVALHEFLGMTWLEYSDWVLGKIKEENENRIQE